VDWAILRGVVLGRTIRKICAGSGFGPVHLQVLSWSLAEKGGIYLKWLEKWKENKAKRKRINEAIDRQLTPETKLAIARAKDHSFPVLAVVGLMVAIAASVVIVNMGAGFKEYFGENTWENIMKVGYEEAGTSMRIAVYLVMGLVIFTLVMWCIELWRDGKKIQQLKREILEKKGGIKNER
jgi:hypothetical protein